MIIIPQIVILTVAYILSSLRNMHFFQLNSYKFLEHRIFLRRNQNKIVLNIIMSVLVLVGIFMPPLAQSIYISVILILFCFTVKPQSRKLSKKPLKYTPRVKRMLFTEALLYIIATIIAILLVPNNYIPLYIFLIMLIMPYMCIVANMINLPIENLIKKYYTNDALKILRSHKRLKIIGITGSYGKTGTKQYLTQILSEKYNTLTTQGNYNTPMGVVLTIRNNLRATDEIFVCEMGAKYVGDIKELCELVNPSIGIITSIGAQHLDTFGNLENVVKTKLEIADYLFSNGGKIFLNSDNEYIRNAEIKCEHVLCGANDVSDVKISDLSADEKGTSFTLTFKDGKSLHTSVNLLGAHNVSNVALAMAVAYELGMSTNEICIASKKIKPPEHRLQLKQIGDSTIIDDAYNSNPAGTKAALKALDLFSGYKIIVTPGMVELGQKSEKYNQEFGEDCASVCDKIVLVGKSQTLPIKNGALKKGFDEENIHVYDDVKEALNFAFSLKTEQRKIILIENDLPDNY